VHETGCLPSVTVQSERELVPLINTRENILEMVQRSPQLSTCRIASRISVSHVQVWQTLHEENLHPYHDHRVHLEPGDPAQCMDLCHWITAHPQLLSIILFTDEVSFTRDGINNSQNVHMCSHDNPHETSVTKFQRRSPDLTPLDYYLWGHMKTLVYETKVDSRAALHHHIFAAAGHIRNHPDNIASSTQSLLMHAENCIATEGGHFEQLLYVGTVF